MSRRLLRSGRSAPRRFPLMFDGLVIGILGTVVFRVPVVGILPPVTGSGR